MQSLCTLRAHRRRWPRNTRYQADATPYLGRTSTGWIAPALPGALTRSPRSRERAASVGLRDRAPWAVLRLIVSGELVDACTADRPVLALAPHGRLLCEPRAASRLYSV